MLMPAESRRQLRRYELADESGDPSADREARGPRVGTACGSSPGGEVGGVNRSRSAQNVLAQGAHPLPGGVAGFPQRRLERQAAGEAGRERADEVVSGAMGGQ